MASDIDTYLKNLQAALAGADRALVQDAVFDAEEYLQAELAAGADWAETVERYGAPEEVAAAYLGTATEHAGAAPSESGHAHGGTPGTAAASAVVAASSTTFQQTDVVTTVAAAPTAAAPAAAGVQAGAAAAAAPSPAAPGCGQQIFGVFVDPRVYKALLYMLISLATGVAYFTIVVTGVSTAAGLLILVIGIPLLLLVLGIVRGMALFEGRLVEVLLGTRMPRRPRAEPPDAGFLKRMLFWVKDGRTWASMAYMILMLPLGIIYFTFAVTGLALSLGLITTPFWIWVSDYSFAYEGATYEWWFPLWATPFAVVAGVVVLIAWLHAVKWIGRGHAVFAKAMLVRLAR